jgi:hypothetical protein
MPQESNSLDIRLASKLRIYLSGKGVHEEVKRGWYPFRGQHAYFYSPVTDIAVGPFAIYDRLIENYDDLQRKIPQLIGHLESCFRENYQQYGGPVAGNPTYPFADFVGNRNPRCFIAIEIESKSPTRKHKLGSIINAAALGRLGIVVGLDCPTVKLLVRILVYLRFLASVDKPTFKTDNTFVVSIEQIERILEIG